MVAAAVSKRENVQEQSEANKPRRLNRWMIAFAVLLLTAVAVGSSACATHSSGSPSASASTTSSSQASTTPEHGLLPGETVLPNGQQSYVFGTNDGISYGSPNVDDLPSVQQYLKEGRLTLMRTWAYATDSDASILQRVQTIKNTGMECMMMLGAPGDFAWLQHVVSMLGSSCDIYEFGNEPDNPNNPPIDVIVKDWIADIPTLRKLNPNAVFGGPATQSPTSEDAPAAGYPSDIAYFLGKTAAAGVRANFLSYHQYTCTYYEGEASCLRDTPHLITDDYDQVLAWEKTYYGTTIPTGISEWNFDPGTQTLTNYGGDNHFVFQWTEIMLKAIEDNHMAFSNQFTTLNYADSGKIDMFFDAPPYSPKAQFYAVVDMGKKAGTGSAITIPTYPAQGTATQAH